MDNNIYVWSIIIDNLNAQAKGIEFLYSNVEKYYHQKDYFSSNETLATKGYMLIHITFAGDAASIMPFGNEN